ncbi:MAG: hypothetical protein DYG89_16305 [Caldilinea sp. CFX5]|nr:hypothetical protein [Caldilinea sp. CFX5]
MALLSKDEIVVALQRLGELAQNQNLEVELLAVGGAVMVLAYEARLSTHDVDAIVIAPREVRIVHELAKEVAQELNWPQDWLNDGAKGYLIGFTEGPILWRAPGILIRRPTAAQLLAMKLSAWRDDVDIADAMRILQEMTGDQVTIWQQVEPHLVPGRELKHAMPSWIYGRISMVKIEEIATAALAGESLLVRALVQDFLRQHPKLTEVPRPQATDERIIALAAGLLELFATRSQQTPPLWTAQIGAIREPIFLTKAAYQMRRLRELCLTESPEPLRKRQFYVTPDYLEYA